MISDANFWMEARRKQGGRNDIFTALLPLLHARQVALDSGVEVDENNIGGSTLNGAPQTYKPEVRPVEKDKALRLPNSTTPVRPVSSRVLRVLQNVMMFAVPLYSLRYNIPAMSMSWRTSCLVDRSTKQLITFGAGDGVKMPKELQCRGCVATEQFFAVLTDQDEVWVSGGLHVLFEERGSWVSGPLGKESSMSHVASKALMLVGHGTRLACVTRALTVRPLSIVLNPVQSIMPSRQVRFLDMGYGEDYYMVGMDSTLYKTLASKRTLGTPRRVMVFSRTPVSRVACGMGFYLIIDQNGQLVTLGRNKKGQLGHGESRATCRKPYLHKALSHHFFVMIAAGDSHSLALTSSGVVYGAGSNEHGQLGLGDSLQMVSTFTPIPLPSKCVGIAAGPAGSMFACKDGCVYVCGLNDHMQLGVESNQRIVCTPSPIPLVTDGVEAYTMDFGSFRKPAAPMHKPLFFPALRTSSSSSHPPVSVRQEESIPAIASSSLSQLATRRIDVAKVSEWHSGITPRKEDRVTCAKCCVLV